MKEDKLRLRGETGGREEKRREWEESVYLSQRRDGNETMTSYELKSQ